jgi:hypothetical protein
MILKKELGTRIMCKRKIPVAEEKDNLMDPYLQVTKNSVFRNAVWSPTGKARGT